MAWFAVTSVMRTIELEFLQPYPRFLLDHTEAEAVEALHRRLAHLLAFLDESQNQLNDDDETTKEWKGKIKEVALRIEEEIESEIINISKLRSTTMVGRHDEVNLIKEILPQDSPRERPVVPIVGNYIQPNRFLEILRNAMGCTGAFKKLVKNKQPMKDLQIKDDDIPSSSKKIGHRHHSAGSKLRSTTMEGRHDEVNLIKEILPQDSPKERPVVPIVGNYIQPNRFLEILRNAMENTGEFMELVKNKQPMKDLQIKDDDDIPSSSQKIEHHSAGSKLRSTTMVGHHDEVNLIKELLLQDSPKERRVVPIVGMGGIGKTKLAQTLYDDPSVSSHFDVVAWTTVSAQPVMPQMLLQLLSTMQISHTQEKEIINKSNQELADLLRRCLMGRRYLIVVDDLWSTVFWDEIQRCFPENSNGSRILVTTRLQEVAISTRSHNYWLNLPSLNPDESWELFSGRILSYGGLSLPPMKLEGIWRHIVEYCKGLPLAIVIVAGLVQASNESLWQSQSKEMQKILCDTVTNSLLDRFSEILRLSYNHLPNVLRVCFLYLGVFREDSAIPVKKLMGLWIAEGFVKIKDERSLEEVAEDYIKDLVSRSLVLVDSLSLDGKIKSCKVHDIVHDFCRNEAMKEGLLHVASTYSSVRTTERWLSFESMYPKLDVQTGFNRYGSLFCFHDDGHMTPQLYQLPATLHFKRLRVLDLGSLHFITGIPSYVADLILLRYLVLCPSKSLSSLPVLKDWNLQTLVLLENTGGSTSADNPNPLMIPEIWELPKFRHLQVCTTFVLGTPTVIHQYIQTVQWLRPFQCTEQVFLRIPNAKVMGIFMEGSVEFGEPNCLDNLRCLNQLEELKIESRHNPVFLPVVDAFPVQLKKLKLKGTLLPWDAMTVIGMLPNLQVLKLINGACQGPHWELTQGSFRQLKSLLIYGSDLMHWEATGNSDFPVLERLVLKECYELEAIPSSFEDILTLQLIELCHCYSRLVNSANQIQQEQRDYGNNELVVRAYNIWRNAEEELEDEVPEELEGSEDSEGDFEE